MDKFLFRNNFNTKDDNALQNYKLSQFHIFLTNWIENMGKKVYTLSWMFSTKINDIKEQNIFDFFGKQQS